MSRPTLDINLTDDEEYTYTTTHSRYNSSLSASMSSIPTMIPRDTNQYKKNQQIRRRYQRTSPKYSSTQIKTKNAAESIPPNVKTPRSIASQGRRRSSSHPKVPEQLEPPKSSNGNRNKDQSATKRFGFRPQPGKSGIKKPNETGNVGSYRKKHPSKQTNRDSVNTISTYVGSSASESGSEVDLRMGYYDEQKVNEDFNDMNLNHYPLISVSLRAPTQRMLMANKQSSLPNIKNNLSRSRIKSPASEEDYGYSDHSQGRLEPHELFVSSGNQNSQDDDSCYGGSQVSNEYENNPYEVNAVEHQYKHNDTHGHSKSRTNSFDYSRNKQSLSTSRSRTTSLKHINPSQSVSTSMARTSSLRNMDSPHAHIVSRTRTSSLRDLNVSHQDKSNDENQAYTHSTIRDEFASSTVSNTSANVGQLISAATERIEARWKERLAKQAEENERILAEERERAATAMIMNAQIAAQTKHAKEDEVKASRDENIALNVTIAQMRIDNEALQRELQQLKKQISQMDQERTSNSHSFWERTTDLARQNRELEEKLGHEKHNVEILEEELKNLRTWNRENKDEQENLLAQVKALETEKFLLTDQIKTLEANLEQERSRRQHVQVNVEQLTVENTALYAQMVALQSTHDAAIADLKMAHSQQNVKLADEMRLLETKNMLMGRRGENSDNAMRQHYQSNTTSSSSTYSNYSSDDMDQQGEYDSNEAAVLAEQLAALTEQLLATRQELSDKTAVISKLEQNVLESEKVRRKLHNTIQELRGNVRVHVRIRPFLPSDGYDKNKTLPVPSIRCDTLSSTVAIGGAKGSNTFAFDKVHAQADTQQCVFEHVADFIQSAMDGYNVCIFAYGQTGSGKTHTMQGSGKAQMRGIIPRSIQLIVGSCGLMASQGWTYTLSVTYFEIYNETIRDLLVTPGMHVQSTNYPIRTNRKGKNYVEGIIKKVLDLDHAEAQVEDIMQLAACNRSVDCTAMNSESSRSHSIFTLNITGTHETQQLEMEGSLSLVDLAGSERLSRSQVTGDRLKESQAINKSLSALADVFQALTKRTPHVPYRNSKLTYVLQPALSGDGKTLMMMNLSPTEASLDESLCSLRFAQNVSQCELGAPVRQIKKSSSEKDIRTTRKTYSEGSSRRY